MSEKQSLLPDGKEDEEERGSSGCLSLSRRQWCVLFVLYLASMSTSFAICLFPPFFPKIAETKGASASVYGFIIGTNCLVSFLVTPFVGENLSKIGMKFSFVAGVFVSGGCCILSGFLEWFPPGLEFVLMAVAIRTVQATANAGVIVSTFAYIAMEFPNSVAAVFSFNRTMTNVAQMAGPIVGGALYEVGGFKMPFLVMGILEILVCFPSYFLLPEYETERKDKKKGLGLMRLLKVPTIWISFLGLILSTLANGFITITLEPQVLRKFSLTPFFVGLVFGLKDGTNSITCPVWGHFCDRSSVSFKTLMIISVLMVGLSLLFLGPFPYLPIPETLGVVIGGLALYGVGIAGVQVVGLIDSMHEAIYAGFPDTADTHGLVSGVWSSLGGAGRFISRWGSGILVDKIGYRDSSAIVTVPLLVLAFLTFGYTLIKKTTPQRHIQETEVESTPIQTRNAGEMGYATSLKLPRRRFTLCTEEDFSKTSSFNAIY